MLAFVAGPAFAEDKPSATQPAKVPIEILKSKHIAVQVKVNGKGPFRLIFDTGAPTMLVSTRLAKEADMIAKNTKKSPFSMFAPKPEVMKTMEIGDLKIDNMPTMVMDHPLVEIMSSILGPIDGIVGYPFWGRYRMTIDYQAKEMTFVPVDYKPADIMQTLMNTMMLRMNGNNAPTILSPKAQWGFTAGKDSDDEEAGVVVREVLKDSAAGNAGLKKDDRLLTLDGRWTDTVVDLFEAAGHVAPGKTVPLKIKRDGKEMTLKVTPASGL
ncbi:MAG TPA: PDZ domain-containing protein [Gemmataceae bacterium]|nr:PDZ domain-containing protein [Gemmataceae bacterium]